MLVAPMPTASTSAARLVKPVALRSERAATRDVVPDGDHQVLDGVPNAGVDAESAMIIGNQQCAIDS